MIKHHNYHLGVSFYVRLREWGAMTRYSASRGIMYSAPPANDEESESAAEAETDAETAEPTPADD